MRGSLDFAGGTAIHVNAGIAALVAVLILGKRKGWPSKGHPPHSMPLVMIGTGILWFGWFGFNAGSALGANAQAVQAFMNTFLAAAAAGLAWAVTERLRDGHFTNLGAASGIVAGLVAITPACGFVSSGSSMLIGLIAGIVCCFAVGLKFKAGYDDALDVVGVHFVGGLVGSLLIGLFADADHFRTWNPEVSHLDGLFYGGGLDLLLEQAIANGVTIIYSGVVTALILLALKATDRHPGLRRRRGRGPRPGGARRVGVLRRRGRFGLIEAVCQEPSERAGPASRRRARTSSERRAVRCR